MTKTVRRWLGMAAVCGAPLVAWAAGPAGADPATTARLSVLAADLATGHTVAFCEARAPARAAAARAAWQAWRKAQDVDGVRRRMAPAEAAPVQAAVDGSRDALHARMAERGTPEAVCDGVVQSFAEPGLDLRSRYPLAYERAPGVTVGAADAGAAPRPTGGEPVSGTVPPDRGTVFTVAQLDRHYATGTVDERRARLRTPVFVKGRAVRRGDSWFLEQRDERFQAWLSVAAGIDLAAHEGRDVVLGGQLTDLPGTVAFLRDGRVVADPTGLAPSTLAADDRMVRSGVPVDRVRAAPGRGARPGDIAAVLFSLQRVLVLFDDGWLYDRRPALPPSDLDVQASRTLEPQHWHRWKRAGEGGYTVRWANARGELSDDWKPLSGMVHAQPWAGGRPRPVEYVNQNFVGGLATGGTHFKSVWRFQADGRFETSALVQSGAGSMAAMNGFSAGQTTHRDGQGTQSAGFATGGGATTTNQARRGDGSDSRGTWRVDGYTLELRYDNGRVARVFAFPWGPKDTHAWIHDGTYLGADTRR